MMIKIKMDRKPHWLVMDKVRAVDYKYMDSKKGKELCVINRKQNVPVRWIENYEEIKNERIAMMVVKYKDKPDEMIFTDDTIYILNDDGKTCESVGVYN